MVPNLKGRVGWEGGITLKASEKLGMQRGNAVRSRGRRLTTCKFARNKFPYGRNYVICPPLAFCYWRRETERGPVLAKGGLHILLSALMKKNNNERVRKGGFCWVMATLERFIKVTNPQISNFVSFFFVAIKRPISPRHLINCACLAFATETLVR